MNEKKSGFDIMELIRKVLFTDFVKGLVITFTYNVSPSTVITIKYPDEEKWIPYRRFRGAHTLNRDANGRELCVACELCAKACPTRCITVVPEEDNTGRGISDRVAKVWKVDLVRCLFCGYCEDACPTRALRLGRDYELACHDLHCTVKYRDGLLLPQSVPEGFEGGVIARSRLINTPDGIEVAADLRESKKRVI
ncbi:MAG: NADH-quinone oxidoreductase subunit I [Deltaproteobacteria bacterium]|nr:NADH-quinone oxidoreductase subunit I [Deltaproteobacteria bacterium]